MPGKAAKITITERQQEILRTICNAPTAPSQLQQRASIILLAFDGLSNPEIAEKVGLSDVRSACGDDAGPRPGTD